MSFAIVPYLLLANFSAIALEYLFRTGYFTSYIAGLWAIIPLALSLEYGIYGAMTKASSYIIAWGAFAVFSYFLRVGLNCLILKEPFNLGIGLGLLMVLAGGILIGKYS